MQGFRIALLSILAGGAALTATSASAQSAGYDRWQADRAYHGADVRAQQAWNDERNARTAAHYGDYRAADAYARAASFHREQARRDARFARHEDRRARHDYWRGW
ncbi:hypothetical protein D9601_03390 [Sphingomonas sp. MA1305]|uniref:hypothetical protein n=1 Tax=Sphingomonas sp. MA1305 TaxID=2479204 RepID=UPI0018DF650E|nr:hypothetical protein [Sphingomonas sp. MA1305]MBI0474408.1 hypothetical protein [Sphingomonas sp. MA1305]